MRESEGGIHEHGGREPGGGTQVVVDDRLCGVPWLVGYQREIVGESAWFHRVDTGDVETALQPHQRDQDMFLQLPGRTTHASFMALQQVLEAATCALVPRYTETSLMCHGSMSGWSCASPSAKETMTGW